MDFTSSGPGTQCTTVVEAFSIYTLHEDGRWTYQLVSTRARSAGAEVDTEEASTK